MQIWSDYQAIKTKI